MIPVYQDVFGLEGNCLAASVASILELPLKEVPNFAQGNNSTGVWFERLWTFLRSRGFEVIPWYSEKYNADTKTTYYVHLDFNALPPHLDGVYCYHIASGPAARGFSHATVGWNGTVVHDPHPSKAGLISVDSYYFLKPIRQE